MSFGKKIHGSLYHLNIHFKEDAKLIAIFALADETATATHESVGNAHRIVDEIEKHFRKHSA
jgi:hypothetical protein